MLDRIVKQPKNLILGRGIVPLKQNVISGEWSQVAAHNQLIQLLYNQGIVGLIVFVLLTCGCLLRCINKRKTVAIAIIGMMALSISLSFNQTTRTFWNLVAYAAFTFPEYEINLQNKSLELSEED